MYADNVYGTWVDEMYCDLDAIELLTLASIFQRAQARVAFLASHGLINRVTAVDMDSELGGLYRSTFRSAVKRCASISNATMFYTYLPSVEEWRAAARRDSS
jgi:hypothetical protein